VNDCIFCKIVAGGIKSKIAYQDDNIVAFEDIAPQAPTHLLFIPREHVDRITEMGDAKIVSMIPKVFKAIAKVVSEKNMDSGYRVVLNQGSEAGQAVGHLHFHLLAGRRMSWPPG